MIDILYKSLKKKAQQQGHGLSCLMMCCLKYARCCVGCFEKFIRFINENAYIMIALSGQGFCRSAYEAFYLIVRNAAQFAVTHLIGKIFCFFGACFITATSTAIGYYIITSAEPYKSHIFSPAFPTILFFIISFVIGYLFMNVYGMAGDTLLFCLCVDKEVSKGQSRSAPKSIQFFEKEYLN